MKNKKLSIAIVLSGLFLITSVLLPFGSSLTSGYVVSARQASPTATPVVWTGTFVIKAGLPFVWLRVAPFSSATSTATIYPNQVLAAATSPNGQAQAWDGTQWWGFVIVPAIGATGWVEINSLEAGPAPTPTPSPAPEVLATWGNSTAVRVKATVSYAWLRQMPSSDAVVIFQVPSGSVMVTIAPAQSDGLQNWWPVLDVQSGLMGWVEQHSLEPASIGADITKATLEPVPTPESWQPGNKVRVRAVAPISWVREAPNGRAQILTRVFAGNILDLVGTPLFGSGEWWWLVKTRGSNITGWLPQSVLEIAPNDA